MRNETKVSKRGNRLAVDLDRAGAIVLRSARRRYKLAELVSRIKPGNRHRDTDWGQPQGAESW